MKKFFRNKMRFCLACSILCLLAVVLFTTCSNPFNVQHKIKDKNSDGLASLQVSRLDSNSTKTRSIMPDISMKNIENWKLELLQGNSDTVVYFDTADEIDKLSISGIKPGEYTIVLSGYDKDQTNNKDVLVLQGQAVQSLKSGSNNVEMSLAPPRTENGRGNLSVSFDFKDSGLEGLILDDFEISMKKSGGDTNLLGADNYLFQNATLTISGSFPSGDYMLSVSLEIGGVQCELAIDPIVKIYDGQISSKTFTMGKDTLQTIQNTRYVSKDGADGGAGLNPMSPWAWETAITWANENPSASNPEATRTLVLVENIELDTVVEVKAPMALRSIGSRTLKYTGSNLPGSGFIQVRVGTNYNNNSIIYYGSLTLEDITITAKPGVWAQKGLVDVQSSDNEDIPVLVLGSGAVLTGHAGSTYAWAGGIYADKARVVLEYGSEISGNTAERGGAVSVANWSTLVVEEGATISGNEAERGGAFYVDNSSKIVLKNTSKIGENTARYGSGLCIEPSIGGGDPEVYSSEGTDATTIAFETAQDFFTLDDDPFTLCLEYPVVDANELTEALIDGSDWPGLVRVTDKITYETVTGVILNPIAVKGTKAIIGGAEYSISNSADTLFSVEDGAKLYLDGITINGKQTAGASLIKVENGGTLIMRDKSKITGHKVQNDEGGGVYVDSGGTFTMDGGTIEKCSAMMGAGVYVANGGTLNLNGGRITNNESSNDYPYGAGLYADSGAWIALGDGKSIGEIVFDNSVQEIETSSEWQLLFIDALINYEFYGNETPIFDDLEGAVDKANTVPVRFAASGSTPAPLSIIMTRGFELTGNLWLDGNITLYRDEKHKKAFFELTDSASLVLGFVTLSGKSGVNEQSVQDVKEALVVAKDAASVVLVNATLEYNTGGGLRLENTATLYVAGNGSINDNSAEQGAGIYLADKSSIVPLDGFKLDVSYNEATISYEDNDSQSIPYGYGGIYAEDSMGDWVEAIYEGVSGYVYENNPKDHNLVTSIPTATFRKKEIGDDSVYVLLSNEDPETEEYIWKLNMPEELRTYRIPIVDNTSGYPPRDLAVYDGEGNEIPSMTLVYEERQSRTAEIIFSHSGGGTIYLKDKNCIAFGITYADPNDINFDNLEELRSYGSSYPTSFVVAEKDGNNEKPFLGPSYYFGQTSSEITSYSKTFSVYNLSGNTISIAGDFANLTISGEESNDNRFRTENFPLNISARKEEEFVIIFGPNNESVWTDFSVDFTLSADEEEFVLEFSGSHSN